jgi:drug/metabolite transporter (DMT)-like permease
MSSTPPPPAASASGSGNVGEIRKPLTVLLLGIITCGIYFLFWYYKSFEEMKDYSGEGLGGLVGLLLSIFCGIITMFVLPAEVGNLYERDGKEKPISGMTGFWNLLPIIGTIVWLFKVQGHLSDFWESKGATRD